MSTQPTVSIKLFHTAFRNGWLRTCSTLPYKEMAPIIDSRKLLAFATLARVGSFTLAARELHLTQSAVSHAIKSLEIELECQLFDRLGRRVLLTNAGRRLLEHAVKILAAMKVARDDLQVVNTRAPLAS
ncbi:MAG: LysR family transcriptional regulator [Opitutaceae bacterium]|nr:LysR family transcriptional regulator [Opitutaceae bacterium]